MDTMSVLLLISIKAVAFARFDVQGQMTSIKVPAQLPAHPAGMKQQICSSMPFVFCCGV
jgi:hypothetical protein